MALALGAACAAALMQTGRTASAASPALKPGIIISHYSFQPGTLTVAKGGTVTWVNEDDDVHTIKSTDGPEAFSSPALDHGNQFGMTFHRAGTYHYVCSVHPFMRGVIVVK
jgi:plastocyanin